MSLNPVSKHNSNPFSEWIDQIRPEMESQLLNIDGLESGVFVEGDVELYIVLVVERELQSSGVVGVSDTFNR